MGQESLHTPTQDRTQGQRGSQGGTSGRILTDEERERERRQSKAEAPEIMEAGRESRAEGAEGEEEEHGEGRSRQLMGKARSAGERVVGVADSAMTAAGERVERLGHALSERGSSGRTGRMLSRTGEAIERGGEYLQESSPTDVSRDIGKVMSKRPVTTLLLGMGIGYLIARAMRRS